MTDCPTLSKLAIIATLILEAPVTCRAVGGVDAHGIHILERAAHSYVQKHEQYPVIAIDHVEPVACNLNDSNSPLLNLGRAYNPTEPSVRPVIILNDSQLERLRQGSDISRSSVFFPFSTQAQYVL